jgi:DNA-directed RNA polymerase subunit RPC12/RpoP
MVEVTCGRCGGTFPYQPGLTSSEASISCPHCSSLLEAQSSPESEPLADGAETIMVPEYRTRRESTPLDGTTLLKSDDTSRNAPGATVTLRGFLSQEGKPSGEGDYRLPGETTVVGREQGAIRVTDDAVSARHFEVEERGSEFFLRDLGSRNGTLLNGHPVRSAKLKSGDRITAGNTTFSFSIRHVIPV